MTYQSFISLTPPLSAVELFLKDYVRKKSYKEKSIRSHHSTISYFHSNIKHAHYDCNPTFSGKMATITSDSRSPHTLTRKPEHPGYEICVVLVSLFYLLHIENTCNFFLYWRGTIIICSHKIRERETKEQRGQWKRLAKTKIWHAYRTGLTQPCIYFSIAWSCCKVFTHWEDTYTLCLLKFLSR